MEKILTANVADNLYWLGRHLERVEATLLSMEQKYDTIIDINFDEGKNFYNHLGIDLDYTDASSFLQNAIFGSHSANLKNLVCAARENAIISRAYIEFEAFGSIIQLAMLFEKNATQISKLDFVFIDEALSLISEIWGELTRKLHRNIDDYFLMLGKNVENVDFNLRIGNQTKNFSKLYEEINHIVFVLSPEAELKDYDYFATTQEILDNVNNKIFETIKF